MRPIIDIQLRGLVKRLEDRKIRVELTEPREGPADRGGLRPDVRRAAAEADDPAPGAGSAGHARARRGTSARAIASASTPPAASSTFDKAEQAVAGVDAERVNAEPDTEWLIQTSPKSESARQEARRAAARRRAPRPASACGTSSASCCCWRSARRSSSRSRRARRSPTATSRRWSATARCRRSPSAEDRIRGMLKAGAASKGSRFTAVRDRGPEAARGARGARRQVHRRGRQPLDRRSARLGHPAALPRRALDLLPPPHGRRRRRRDVVRPQQGEDLRRRRRQGAASATSPAWTKPKRS